jgi:hypothetical protein
MDVVVVLYKEKETWVLFGVFSGIEHAMRHTKNLRSSKIKLRYIRAEIGMEYSKENPASEGID